MTENRTIPVFNFDMVLRTRLLHGLHAQTLINTTPPINGLHQQNKKVNFCTNNAIFDDLHDLESEQGKACLFVLLKPTTLNDFGVAAPTNIFSLKDERVTLLINRGGSCIAALSFAQVC